MRRRIFAIALAISLLACSRPRVPSSRLVGHWERDEEWAGEGRSGKWYGPIDKHGVGSFIEIIRDGTRSDYSYRILMEEPNGQIILIRYLFDTLSCDVEIYIPPSGKTMRETMKIGGEDLSMTYNYVDGATEPP